MFGHIALSLPFHQGGLFASIALIVIGTGLLKPNIADMVGGLYSDTDRRRDAGFSIYLFGINLGAAVAPWAVPWAADGFGLHLFGNQMNFHAGFSLAAIGMFFGLAQYLIDGRKYLSKDSLAPDDPIEKNQVRPVVIKSLLWVGLVAIILLILVTFGQLNITNVITIVTADLLLHSGAQSQKVTKYEKRRVGAYIPLFIAAVVFWTIDESGSVGLAMFAQQRTIFHIGTWHFAAANFQTLNLIFMMMLTPLFASLWDRLKKKPSAPTMFVPRDGLRRPFLCLHGPTWLNSWNDRWSGFTILVSGFLVYY